MKDIRIDPPTQFFFKSGDLDINIFLDKIISGCRIYRLGLRFRFRIGRRFRYVCNLYRYGRFTGRVRKSQEMDKTRTRCRQ